MNVMNIKFWDRIPKINSTKVAEFWDKKAKSLLRISLNFYKNITTEGAKIFFAYLKHSLNWLHQRSMWKSHHQLWSQKDKFCNIPMHIRDQKLKEYIRWISNSLNLEVKTRKSIILIFVKMTLTLVWCGFVNLQVNVWIWIYPEVYRLISNTLNRNYNF